MKDYEDIVQIIENQPNRVQWRVRQYSIQQCFICRRSDSTVSEDATCRIEPRSVVTSALAVRSSNYSARSHPRLSLSCCFETESLPAYSRYTLYIHSCTIRYGQFWAVNNSSGSVAVSTGSPRFLNFYFSKIIHVKHGKLKKFTVREPLFTRIWNSRKIQEMNKHPHCKCWLCQVQICGTG